MPTLTPIILSGGSGTRLWPLSREHYPKQLLALAGPNTLLQDTAMRLDGYPGTTPPLIVCNEEHRFLVAEQLRQIGHAPCAILLEPFGRNTAPALTLAALAASGPDSVLLVMPADHVLTNRPAFHEAVSKGHEQVRAGKLVTFGIIPHRPETGYGYIRKGPATASRDVFELAEFVEKPGLEKAAGFVASGEYVWNSGMFMMTAGRWLEEIRNRQPGIADACEAAWHARSADMDFMRLDRSTFERCPAKSIDYAVMESAQNAVVIPLDAGWSDIGAWSSLWSISSHDEHGNAQQGDVLMIDSRNTLAIAQSRFVATVGITDLVVVETADAVLVAHKDHAQRVKDIVAELKKQGRSEHVAHRRVYRPWGSYEGVDSGERFQVKRITVSPGAALSLQMHHHRAEHWIVVKGTARVTRGDEVFLVSENESTYIPLGTRHRLENPGSLPLEIIEVQSGGYLGEDDIVRYEDRYNREDPK